MGLSYTVYYTAGCWQPEGVDADSPLLAEHRKAISPPRCDYQRFEVALAEFDALSGSFLRARNITNVHARRMGSHSPCLRWYAWVGQCGRRWTGGIGQARYAPLVRPAVVRAMHSPLAGRR